MSGIKPHIKVSVAMLKQRIKERVEKARGSHVDALRKYTDDQARWQQAVGEALFEACARYNENQYPSTTTSRYGEATADYLMVRVSMPEPKLPVDSFNYEAARRDLSLLDMTDDEYVDIPLSNSEWSKYL